VAATLSEEKADPAGDAPKPALSVGRRRGRRALLGVYYGVVLAICVASTVQITKEVFFAQASPSPYTSCREGLGALAKAVERARRAATDEAGEDAAIDRFRQALQPEWTYRDAVSTSCRGSEPDEGALDAIERLRYAEEHAVRREAGDLAPLRRKVQTIVEKDLALPTAPTHAP
jgi:hypothetical protein